MITKMSHKNKCRVCLANGATHSIFRDVESKESIHSKLFQCFKEQVEDIEGYPRKICETCLNQLDIVYSFITKYRISCKLLETGLQVVKQEAFSDHDDIDNEYVDMEYLKNEPDSDGLETLDGVLEKMPLQCIKKKKDSKKCLTEIKAKLRKLSEINFKKKPKKIRRNVKPSSKIASSILEAEFEWSGERWCIKSSKITTPKEEKPKLKQREPKLLLPKPKVKLPQQPKLCDICGDIFKDHDKLTKHRKNVHFNKPLPCPQCPKILANKIELSRHVRRIHSTVNLFVCEPCGKGFNIKGDLLKHMQVVHLKTRKKKRYHCKLCDKTYACAKSVLIHERSVHTGVRPAECNVCGSSFYHEEYLKEHMRLHTGEAPFKCPICGRGYAQRGNMKSHIAHNHRLSDLDEETKKKFKPHWFKWLKAP